MLPLAILLRDASFEILNPATKERISFSKVLSYTTTHAMFKRSGPWSVQAPASYHHSTTCEVDENLFTWPLFLIPCEISNRCSTEAGSRPSEVTIVKWACHALIPLPQSNYQSFAQWLAPYHYGPMLCRLNQLAWLSLRRPSALRDASNTRREIELWVFLEILVNQSLRVAPRR